MAESCQGSLLFGRKGVGGLRSPKLNGDRRNPQELLGAAASTRASQVGLTARASAERKTSVVGSA
jgi:hypothetical protein